MPLAVGRPRSVAAVEAALAKEDKLIAVFAQKGPSIEEPSLDDCYSIGTLGVIKKMGRAEDMLQVVVQGIQRIEIIEVVQERPFVSLNVRLLPEPQDSGTEIEALQRAVLDLASKMLELVQPQMQISISHIISEVENPLHQVYLLGSLLSLDTTRCRC
jgi:ATP-dependent Lon protease